MSEKVIISLSGGLDSTVLLAHLLHTGREAVCYGFYYGSKHNEYENKAAKSVAAYYGVPFDLIDVASLFTPLNSSLLTGGAAIPEGHYSDETMKSTVVPCRNMIFASLLSSYAVAADASFVALGIHQGDHAIYPDCRPEFYHAMNIAINAASDSVVSLLAPFLQYDKSAIVSIGRNLKVPFEMTRTCYKEQPVACGVCGSCVERQEAFFNLGMEDPVPYEVQC